MVFHLLQIIREISVGLMQSLSEKILNILNKMDIGETSKPIKRQNSIIFLKIADKRSSKTKDINLSELKSKLVNQKE